MIDSSKSTSGDDFNESFLDDDCFQYDSRDMKWRDVAVVEEKLTVSPDHFESHARLAYFYSNMKWRYRNRFQIALSKFRREPEIEEIKTRSIEHWFWIIRNHPASKVLENSDFIVTVLEDKNLQAQVHKHWLEQIAKYPDDARVHWNAAQFINIVSSSEAFSLRKKACILDPTNPKYPESLAQLLSVHADVVSMKFDSGSSLRKSETIQSLQNLALSMQEDALSKSDSQHQLDALVRSAEKAFKAGHFEKATRYAQRIVDFGFVPRPTYNQQPCLHSAHIILGRIALQEGDKDKALECLKAASNIEVDELSLRHPDLVLASELLLLGEKTAVENYLRDVMRFYPSPDLGRLYFLVRFNLLPKSTRLDQSQSKIYMGILFCTVRTLDFFVSILRLNR